MKADSIALIIAASGGFILGTIVWIQVCGLFLSRRLRRVEKETWAAANRFYSRKAVGP